MTLPVSRRAGGYGQPQRARERRGAYRRVNGCLRDSAVPRHVAQATSELAERECGGGAAMPRESDGDVGAHGAGRWRASGARCCPAFSARAPPYSHRPRDAAHALRHNCSAASRNPRGTVSVSVPQSRGTMSPCHAPVVPWPRACALALLLLLHCLPHAPPLAVRAAQGCADQLEKAPAATAEAEGPEGSGCMGWSHGGWGGAWAEGVRETASERGGKGNLAWLLSVQQQQPQTVSGTTRGHFRSR
ncbi:unnamed protein product [Closterium sp. NIES-54]